MSDRARAGRPAALGSVAALVVWAGVLTRVLVETDDPELIPWYVGGLALFLVVHVAVVRWPLSTPLLHLAFALQAALVLVLLSLDPDHDILTGLLALECYQAAVVFSGRARLVWVAGLVSLIPVSLVMGTGVAERPLRGVRADGRRRRPGHVRRREPGSRGRRGREPRHGRGAARGAAAPGGLRRPGRGAGRDRGALPRRAGAAGFGLDDAGGGRSP